MVKVICLIFFLTITGALEAQEIALPLQRDVYKVKLKFKDRKRKVKGVLYRLTDSTIIVADTYDRRDFLENEVRLRSYPFTDLRRIKYKSMKVKMANTLAGFGTGFVLGYFSVNKKSLRFPIGLSLGLTGFLGVAVLDGYGAAYPRHGSLRRRRWANIEKHSVYSAPSYQYHRRPIRFGVEVDFYNDEPKENIYIYQRFVRSTYDQVNFSGQSFSIGGTVQIPIFRRNNYISAGLKYYNRRLTSSLVDVEGKGTLDMKEVAIPLKLWLYSKDWDGFQLLGVIDYEKTVYMAYTEKSDFPSVRQSTGLASQTWITRSDHLELGVGFQIRFAKRGNLYILGKIFNNDTSWKFRYLNRAVHLKATGLEVGYLHNIFRK